MTVPFETFLVFSTNLNPTNLGDEAFLRRIQYKLLLRSPAENEFIRIFETFCTARRIPFSRDLIKWFIEKYYKQTKRPFRRCHPRDILGHALNLIHFEKLPLNLTPELLDRAYESCFLQGDEQIATEAAPPPPILPVVVKSCADVWGDKAALIATAFGSLVFAASFRDRTTGKYHEPQSAAQFGETETSRVIQKMHQRAFLEWLALSVTQQNRDLSKFLASPDGNAVKLSLDNRDLLASLPPAEARAEEIKMFTRDLAPMLEQLSRQVSGPPLAVPQELTVTSGA
jgi:hypothetical protein